MIDPRSCCFCDMDQATEERIPACTRPPTKKIRGTVFGHPALMDVCDHHYDRMPEDAKPNKFVGPIISGMAAESDAGRQEMMRYLSQEKVVEFSCKGCGAILVREHEQDGALGLIMKGFGIDLLVVRKHLDECDFRRVTA